jgi:hypothetical protein
MEARVSVKIVIRGNEGRLASKNFEAELGR